MRILTSSFVVLPTRPSKLWSNGYVTKRPCKQGTATLLIGGMVDIEFRVYGDPVHVIVVGHEKGKVGLEFY